MSASTTPQDSINRLTWTFGGFAALAGALTLAGAPLLTAQFLPAVGTAFQYDTEFLNRGAFIVIGLWSLNALLFAAVYVEGKWRPLTRTLDLVLTSAWAAALVWLINWPKIFASAHTDSTTKGFLFIVLGLVLLSLFPMIRRVASNR